MLRNWIHDPWERENTNQHVLFFLWTNHGFSVARSLSVTSFPKVSTEVLSPSPRTQGSALWKLSVANSGHAEGRKAEARCTMTIVICFKCCWRSLGWTNLKISEAEAQCVARTVLSILEILLWHREGAQPWNHSLFTLFKEWLLD